MTQDNPEQRDRGKRYVLTEVSRILGVEQGYVVHCLRSHWIEPVDPSHNALDQEDLARLRLISDLQKDFGVNDEAIPIILHLLDQLYLLRAGFKRAG